MSQEERDGLHWLKLVRDKKITQKQAAERMGVTPRWVRTLLKKLKRRGDRAVVHGLRGKPSNRKIADRVREGAVELIRAEYRDFGPTLAREHLLVLMRRCWRAEELRLALDIQVVELSSLFSAVSNAWRERVARRGPLPGVAGYRPR